LLTAITPDAASGSTGISQRFCAIQVIGQPRSGGRW
jgi:hypothetical protein